MRFLPLAAVSVAALSALPVTAQNSIVMTGRFFANSLDTSLDTTPRQALSFLDDSSLWLATPSATSQFGAKDVYPYATFDAYWGDAYGDNNFTRFDGFAGTFDRWDIAGLFVPVASKSNAAFQPTDVYWTIRNDGATQVLQVLDGFGASTVTVRPGDWLRLRPNGFIEFFITLDQFDTACNAASTVDSFGATAMCQDAAGNLYFSPAEQGGITVNGNSTPQVASRETIIRIDAADITYTPEGTVASVNPDSAYVIFDGATTQGWLAASGAQDNGRSGSVLPMAAFYNIVGLDLDPNGGMLPATVAIDDPANPGTDLFPMMPNFVMTGDNGFFGGTIWSSAGGGSVAVINGVQCGSTVPGAPATGAWLGTQTDGDLLPTLMGFQIIGAPTERPLLIDAPRAGAITTFDSTFEVDVNGLPGELTTLLISLTPPFSPVIFSAETAPLGSLFAPASWPDLLTISPAPFDVSLPAPDANGYTALVVNNPIFSNPGNQALFMDIILICQAVQIRSAQFDVLLSNPITLQFK